MMNSETDGVYDMEAALAAFGDEGVVREALETYLKEAEGMLSQMRQALLDNNLTEQKRIVHWLRGGLSYLHAPRVRRACLKLDQQVDIDGPAKQEAFDELEREMRELESYVGSVTG